ncbi:MULTISPECIES: FxSxx-COOH cyclophane-containing RiPP peptide [unclassified Streptomyces]|uniref:FxSxx-COOH cyclophane-containing RiPP peptide n=1 Tax=unclassified Streptomyces TaxID=2593676 RepID=UPI00081D4EDD|nr:MULTISPECIES: FxSxx-COOH cyclophane-containing RiPP peptide [unclassified Streptomyces]MYZ40298.1 FXSXX-COOH protein [Streptomyces sp. SID4917]SCG07214.1 FXSXX-COOH protein [Streptomyces sp. MnatMP-M17]
MSDVTYAAVDGAPDDRALNDGTAVGGGELPDLLALDLETLRTLDHPVLAEVVADLRGRAEQPREMLWGFTNAF